LLLKNLIINKTENFFKSAKNITINISTYKFYDINTKEFYKELNADCIIDKLLEIAKKKKKGLSLDKLLNKYEYDIMKYHENMLLKLVWKIL